MEAPPVRSTATLRVALLLGCLVLIAWVQHHALLAFFSSPDDLIHLQQAVGLKPLLPTPLRFLSQVLYFRGMVSLFGLQPLAFHLVSLLTHLSLVALVYAFLRDVGFRSRVALTSVVLFGAMPLHITLLSSAVGMNDELALLFGVAALWLAQRGRSGLGAGVLTLALLCKESVLCLPLLLLLLRREGETASSAFRRAAPLLGVAVAGGILILVLRPLGLAPGGTVYSMGLGANLFHNLMTYTSWAVELRDAMPDLVTSYSTTAWPLGLATFGALSLAYWRLPASRFAIRVGLAWWLLGLIPVLPLRFQTYRHYLYPALPGLALAITGAVVAAAEGASVVFARSEERKSAVVWALLLGCLLGYGIRADQLIGTRLAARVTGTDLPLDPVMRRRVVAERAIGSMAQKLGPRRTSVAILTLPGAATVFGTRSGRAEINPEPPMPAYDLLSESIDHGGALKLFFRQIDSVAFITEWTPAERGKELFLSYPGGYLVGGGTGPAALEEVTLWMFRAGWYAQSRDYLTTVVQAYPRQPSLRLAYAGALFKLGETAAARAQLNEVIRIAGPQDSSAVRAKLILESMPAGS